MLARQTNRAFAYAWPVGRAFGAPLDQLWDVTDPRVPTRWSRVLAVRYPYRDESLAWLDQAKDESIWQIQTAHALALPPVWPSWEHELRTLTPVEVVASRVVQVRERELGGQPYIGVMIRTHSVAHTQTLAASPVEWCVRRLQEIRAALPSVPVFISSDTERAAQELVSQVKGCFSLTDKGAYNSARALQSSVADLYLLAGSIHILGAHYSSFPELARSLGGDGLALETSHTDAATRFEERGTLTQPIDVRVPHVRVPVRIQP